mmetsp:Transcript_46/g.172  ORF Transcript_46/g.172 Transcript_46/m.172 type:complete len:239 (-) Transcript_46:23-739(-)
MQNREPLMRWLSLRTMLRDSAAEAAVTCFEHTLTSFARAVTREASTMVPSEQMRTRQSAAALCPGRRWTTSPGRSWCAAAEVSRPARRTWNAGPTWRTVSVHQRCWGGKSLGWQQRPKSGRRLPGRRAAAAASWSRYADSGIPASSEVPKCLHRHSSLAECSSKVSFSIRFLSARRRSQTLSSSCVVSLWLNCAFTFRKFRSSSTSACTSLLSSRSCGSSSSAESGSGDIAARGGPRR